MGHCQGTKEGQAIWESLQAGSRHSHADEDDGDCVAQIEQHVACSSRSSGSGTSGEAGAAMMGAARLHEATVQPSQQQGGG